MKFDYYLTLLIAINQYGILLWNNCTSNEIGMNENNFLSENINLAFFLSKDVSK